MQFAATFKSNISVVCFHSRLSMVVEHVLVENIWHSILKYLLENFFMRFADVKAAQKSFNKIKICGNCKYES